MYCRPTLRANLQYSWPYSPAAQRRKAARSLPRGTGMDDDTPKKSRARSDARRRQPPVKVWLDPDERATIEQRAAMTGMSLSAYLRAAGLSAEIRAITDADAVTDMLKVSADLGRVAGLLKLWLATKRGEGAPPVNVELMMDDFRALQSEIRNLAGSVLYDR